MASLDQQLSNRVRHPALRKSTAINDEILDEENSDPDQGTWDSNNIAAISSLMRRAQSNLPTATIHCTKSEPLTSEDIGIIPAIRSIIGTHAHSVPPTRTSRLLDIAAMGSVSFSVFVKKLFV